MECGDSSPPSKAKFISPSGDVTRVQYLTGEKVYCEPMNWPVQGGDKSPHSISEAAHPLPNRLLRLRVEEVRVLQVEANGDLRVHTILIRGPHAGDEGGRARIQI